jgi:hypothetical protein
MDQPIGMNLAPVEGAAVDVQSGCSSVGTRGGKVIYQRRKDSNEQ